MKSDELKEIKNIIYWEIIKKYGKASENALI